MCDQSYDQLVKSNQKVFGTGVRDSIQFKIRFSISLPVDKPLNKFE